MELLGDYSNDAQKRVWDADTDQVFKTSEQIRVCEGDSGPELGTLENSFVDKVEENLPIKLAKIAP